MKNLIFAAIIFIKLASAGDILASQVDGKDIKAKNAYEYTVAIKALKDYRSRPNDSGYKYDYEGRRVRVETDSRNYDYGSNARPDKKVIIIGNTALGFSLDRCYSDAFEFHLIKTGDSAEVKMVISDMTPDLSSFFIDLTVTSKHLYDTLSLDKATSITTRYKSTVVSCDGEPMRYGTDSDDIRDIVANIAGQDFVNSLGCKMLMTKVGVVPEFDSDPYNFMRDSPQRFKPDVKTEIVKSFDLNVSTQGIATLKSLDVITGGGTLQASQGKEIVFSLKAKSIPATENRKKIFEAATKISQAVYTYSEDLKTSLPDRPVGPKEARDEREGAISRDFKSINEDIAYLRDHFSELSVEDQLYIHMIIGRGYFFADQARKRINDLKHPGKGKETNLDTDTKQ